MATADGWQLWVSDVWRRWKTSGKVQVLSGGVLDDLKQEKEIQK